MIKSCFDAVFSAVIGRQGEMINRLQAESGARIQVAPGERLGGGEQKCMMTIINEVVVS